MASSFNDNIIQRRLLKKYFSDFGITLSRDRPLDNIMIKMISAVYADKMKTFPFDVDIYESKNYDMQSDDIDLLLKWVQSDDLSLPNGKVKLNEVCMTNWECNIKLFNATVNDIPSMVYNAVVSSVYFHVNYSLTHYIQKYVINNNLKALVTNRIVYCDSNNALDHFCIKAKETHIIIDDVPHYTIIIKDRSLHSSYQLYEMLYDANLTFISANYLDNIGYECYDFLSDRYDVYIAGDRLFCRTETNAVICKLLFG